MNNNNQIKQLCGAQPQNNKVDSKIDELLKCI